MNVGNAWNNYLNVIKGHEYLDPNQQDSSTHINIVKALNLGFRVAAVISLVTVVVPAIFGIFFLVEKGYESLKGRATQNTDLIESETTKKTQVLSPHKKEENRFQIIDKLHKSIERNVKNSQPNRIYKGNEGVNLFYSKNNKITHLRMDFEPSHNEPFEFVEYYFSDTSFVSLGKQRPNIEFRDKINFENVNEIKNLHKEAEHLKNLNFAFQALENANQPFL